MINLFKDQNPLISVVLPVYNQEKYIAETIESVLNQTYKKFEFLILDDGSSDNSAQLIREYASKDERIISYFHKNSGKCNATNFLVEKAKGDLLFFLDADDVMFPNRIEKQLTYHQSNPKVDATSSHCMYINANGKFLGQQRYPFLKSIEECKQAKETKKNIQCAYTSLAVTKRAYAEIGGLRKEFWPSEDTDFVNRLVEKGYILVIIQETLMKYRLHPSSITSMGQWNLFDKFAYANYCSGLRKIDKPEVSFAEFIEERQKESWWTKVIRLKQNYAIILQRRAHISLYNKNYISFIWQLSIASALSPSFIYAILVNRVKVITQKNSSLL